MKKNVAVILAAGKGSRMGANINKQFLTMKEKPILYYTLKAFCECKSIDEVVLVSAKSEIEFCREDIVERYKFTKVKAIIEGGAERQHSVFNGLKAIKNCDVVLIHDGARPFVTDAIIEDGIKNAHLYGVATCGVNPKDTIKVKNEEGFSNKTLNRNNLFIVQTPQCFKYDLIFKCHVNLNHENISVTVDTMVVEKYGHKVFLYDGSYNNIKITTPEDLIIGERILEGFYNN
jgi:2-C-methyl-D-erythritol 4-phosphate cytidylyltransferase